MHFNVYLSLFLFLFFFYCSLLVCLFVFEGFSHELAAHVMNKFVVSDGTFFLPRYIVRVSQSKKSVRKDIFSSIITFPWKQDFN